MKFQSARMPYYRDKDTELEVMALLVAKRFVITHVEHQPGPQASNRISSNLYCQIDFGPGTGQENLPKYWQFWPRHKNKM